MQASRAIEIQAKSEEEATHFVEALRREAPIAARSERCHLEPLDELGTYKGF